MTWDSLISSIVVTGAAATKVSSGVFYENLDGTLVIDVLTDFVPGDFVVVSGLSFMGFAGPPSSSSLELEVDNAGGVIDWDDKTITIDVASDVKVFAATATDSQVELHWVYPEFGACVRVLIMRDEGDFPTPFTGTLVHDDVCGVAGTAVSLVDPNVTSNGIEYFYSAFVDHGSGYTPGKLVTVRPFDTSLEVKWAYSTGATSMAPPGLRIQSGSSFVYAVSNDSILHSLTGGDPGGDWPPAWTPYKLGAPAQTRSPVVNFNVGGPNGAAFLGSQDGQVYAIDAVTGALKWKEPIASMVQAAPAGHFLAYKPSAYDLVLVGTRNSSGANSFEAVYVHDGTPRWSFTNSLTQGGNGAAMGIISGGAAIDYTNPRAYFASRGKAGGSSRTLWCIGFNGTSVTLLWNASLGNIDGSPVLFGGRVYVGTNGGVLYALNATTGLVYWSLPLGDGAIKGFPFPRFGSNHLIVSTNNKIWSIEDRGTSGAVDPGWPVSDIPSPSIPLQVPGSQVVLVGSSDGKLYQLDVLVPLPPKSVQLGDGTFAVGAPTMDVLTSMIYVGTDAGVVYGVAFPLP
jgi:outer membrane protein assembly factor BamB